MASLIPSAVQAQRAANGSGTTPVQATLAAPGTSTNAAGQVSPEALLSGADSGAPAARGDDAPADDQVARFLKERGLVSGTPTTPTDSDDSKGLRQRVSQAASELVLTAMNFLGVRYRRGGQSAESGFDCSGFTRYIFENSVGLVLPRRAEEQARAPGLMAIERHELKPGDLVFFNTLRRTFSHVGIYVGDNKFIHSPRTGGEVRVEDMSMAYWVQRYNGARRALGREAAAAAAPLADTLRATTAAPAAGSELSGR